MRILIVASFFISVLLFVNCGGGNEDSAPGAAQVVKTCAEQLGTNQEWSTPVEVIIDGYSASAMEPKMSSDEVVLFWNDKPASGDANMNIQYAILQPSGHYLYIGILPGTVDSGALDGVPALDANGNFYFISLRTAGLNSQTIYGGGIHVLGVNSLEIQNTAAVDAAVVDHTAGHLDFDVDVSNDGTKMIASRGVFSGANFPDTSKLALYSLSPTTRQASPLASSDSLLQNVNLSGCRVYAGNLSADMKELYYTQLPGTAAPAQTDFVIAVAKRASTSEPFGRGEAIAAISGSAVEGPSVSAADGKSLLFHRFDSVTGRFKIYRTTRP